jgi:hypothetical protein
MKRKQRESSAKYLYDLSKGVALLTVVSPWVTSQGSWITIVLGVAGTVVLFLWAYWLEGTNDTV